MTRAEVDMLVAMIDAYYIVHTTGGPHLHAVLDDDNFERHHVEWALSSALKAEDYAGAGIAQLLLKMPDEALSDLVEYGHPFIPVVMEKHIVEAVS